MLTTRHHTGISADYATGDDMKSFAHIDPQKVYVYKSTVLYGFVTDDYCFTCRVRNGYLTGQRAGLPEEFSWAIGQHIETVLEYVNNIMPLRIVAN